MNDINGIINYRQGVEFGTPKVYIKYHASPLSYTFHMQSYYGKAACLVSNEYICIQVMYTDFMGEHKIQWKVGVGLSGTFWGNLEQYWGVIWNRMKYEWQDQTIPEQEFDIRFNTSWAFK